MVNIKMSEISLIIFNTQDILFIAIYNNVLMIYTTKLSSHFN